MTERVESLSTGTCKTDFAVPVTVGGNRARFVAFSRVPRRRRVGKGGETSLARIAGVNIPTNKRVVIALQYIHGIGPTAAKKIVETVKIPAERRTNQLTDAEVARSAKSSTATTWSRATSAAKWR